MIFQLCGKGADMPALQGDQFPAGPRGEACVRGRASQRTGRYSHVGTGLFTCHVARDPDLRHRPLASYPNPHLHQKSHEWCFDPGQGAQLCGDTEAASNKLREINIQIAQSACKPVEPETMREARRLYEITPWPIEAAGTNAVPRSPLLTSGYVVNDAHCRPWRAKCRA
jgi:hypothetical protein